MDVFQTPLHDKTATVQNIESSPFYGTARTALQIQTDEIWFKLFF
jgi:hypothetical protein